jgi:hypothetical protein
VIGLDFRGFGKSGGLPGYIDNIEDLIEDNLALIKCLD